MAEERWAIYDTSGFPYVKVELDRNIKSYEDFKHYTDSWIRLYDNEQSFMIYFDATNVGFVNIKYAFKMSSFIRELKRRKYKWLQCSVIKVKSCYVRFLLRLIFFLESPIIPVHIISDPQFNFSDISTRQNYLI